jgi:hypothetical protein
LRGKAPPAFKTLLNGPVVGHFAASLKDCLSCPLMLLGVQVEASPAHASAIGWRSSTNTHDPITPRARARVGAPREREV